MVLACKLLWRCVSVLAGTLYDSLGKGVEHLYVAAITI